MKLWPFRPDLVSPLLRLDAEQEASIAPLIDPNTPTYGELLEIAETLEKRLDETIVERDELVAALDWQRPAPDPKVLGPLLKAAWFRPTATGSRWDYDAMWTAVAETAIDHVRGLWPLDVTSAPERRLDREAGALFAAGDHLDTQPCRACGRPFTPDHDIAAEGPTVRHPFKRYFTPLDIAGVGDQCEPTIEPCCWASGPLSFICTRPAGHQGQHVATVTGGRVVETWPTKPSSGGGGSAGAGVSTAAPTGAPTPDDPWPGPSTRVADDYAALTDAYLEDLARALCHHDTATTGLHWDSTVVALREGYFNLAAAVILAGWLPERLARTTSGSTSPGVDG